VIVCLFWSGQHLAEPRNDLFFCYSFRKSPQWVPRQRRNTSIRCKVRTKAGTPKSRERRHMHLRVLVVDDSKLARMVMASAFRRIRPDWELVEATNADDALRTIQGGSVDIALVDFNMPGTDGLELLARIRKGHPKMPIALVSANLQNEILARTRELNATFVPKPLTDEAIEAFLSGASLRLQRTVQ
jgi:CheY-like chemotaxis protein